MTTTKKHKLIGENGSRFQGLAFEVSSKYKCLGCMAECPGCRIPCLQVKKKLIGRWVVDDIKNF